MRNWMSPNAIVRYISCVLRWKHPVRCEVMHQVIHLHHFSSSTQHQYKTIFIPTLAGIKDQSDLREKPLFRNKFAIRYASSVEISDSTFDDNLSVVAQRFLNQKIRNTTTAKLICGQVGPVAIAKDIRNPSVFDKRTRADLVQLCTPVHKTTIWNHIGRARAVQWTTMSSIESCKYVFGRIGNLNCDGFFRHCVVEQKNRKNGRPY